MLEELKDNNERMKNLELLNVHLTEDNKVLRKKLDQVNEQNYLAELKVAECEKFVSKLSKEYENKSAELKASKQNEQSLMAELTKERNERKNVTIQRDKDVIVIQDLQRQVKEMELILKRKHPDSVSALIGTEHFNIFVIIFIFETEINFKMLINLYTTVTFPLDKCCPYSVFKIDNCYVHKCIGISKRHT